MFDKDKKPSLDGTVNQTEVKEVKSDTSGAVPVLDASLVQLLLQEKAEEAAEKMAEREARRRKAAARASGSSETLAQERNNILACNHTKGGKFKKLGQATDYAFNIHSFIDSVMRVRCGLCGFKVYGPRNNGTVSADTREFIYRDRGNGYEKMPNPTFAPERNKPGIGFAEALQMARESSSNTESRSEQVLTNPAILMQESKTQLTAAQQKIAELEERLAKAEGK